MLVKDLLKHQRQFAPIGRIRAGITDGKRPMTIDTYRFTSASEEAVEAAAAAYGGTPRPWDNRGHKQFEVITETAKLLVTIPPYDETISMSYEMWTAAGCQRRCDSEKTLKPGGPCLCAPLLEQYDEEDRGRERARLAKLKTPQACALHVRISVVLPDLPDVGVWRYDTKSFYGTLDLLGKLRIMEMARAQGVFLPARMWIDHVVDVSDGQTRHYPVPKFSLLNTTREIATGQLAGAGMAAQLPPAPGEQPKAITGGNGTAPGPEAAVPEPRKGNGRARKPRTAQDVADDAANATTREEIEALSGEMKRLQWEQDYVYPDLDPDGVHDELQNILRDKWRKLPAGGGD